MDQKILNQLLEEILTMKKALANVVTKNDAKSFATKNDLENLEQRLHAKIKYDIDNAVIQIGDIVDKRKADRSEVAQVDKRVTKIERKLAI